jgi:hypothetical protein
MPSYPNPSAEIDTHYVDACEQFEHLVGRLKHPDAQELTHGEVEAVIHSEGMELLRRLTQGYLDQRSAQEPIQEQLIGEDGLPRTHRRAGCERRLETRFGEVRVTRRGYGARGLESVFPLDAELNLPPDKYSHGLREALVEEVIQGSFDEAVAHLERSGGGQMAKRQSEEVAVHLSPDLNTMTRSWGYKSLIFSSGRGISAIIGRCVTPQAAKIPGI